MKKYAPEKVFILDDNGYIEITYEELCERTKLNKEYAAKLFLPLHGMLMEVTESAYRAFYKEERRWKYLIEQSEANGDISYDMLTTDEFCGENVIADSGPSVEELVDAALMDQKLKVGLANLTEDERNLIQAVYFEGKTLRQYAQEKGVCHNVIQKKKLRILAKLKKFLEK